MKKSIKKFMGTKMSISLIMITMIVIVSAFISQKFIFAQEIIPMTQLNTNNINSEDILTDIRNGKNVFIEDATIIGNLDFSKVLNFSAKLNDKDYNVYLDNQIVIKNSVINGDILGLHTDEEGNRYYVTFNRAVSFSGSKINGQINFYKNVFNHRVNFSYSTFNKKVIFKNVLFNNEANFEDSEFKSEADFRMTQFYNKSIFSKSIFHNNASFLAGKFNHTAEFDLVNFKSGVFDFYRAVFNEAYFGYAVINGLGNFSETTYIVAADFGAVKISASDFTKSSFNGRVLFELAEMLSSDFSDSQINTSVLNVKDADFGRFNFSNTTRFGLSYSPVTSREQEEG